MVRASASQSVDLAFIPLVESYQKTLKNGIHSFPAWRSAFSGGCGEQTGKFACCALGQDTSRDAPTFVWKIGGPVFPLKRGLVAGRASDRKTNAMAKKCRYLLWRPLIGGNKPKEKEVSYKYTIRGGS